MKVIILFSVFALLSCSKKQSTVQGNVQGASATSVNKCQLKNATNLKITGYKFEDKSPVNGTFKEWSLEHNLEGSTVSELLTGAKFSFIEKSLDFGNSARNKNILRGLFNLISGDEITGEIQRSDEEKKKAYFNINWGGKSMLLVFDYILNVFLDTFANKFPQHNRNGIPNEPTYHSFGDRSFRARKLIALWEALKHSSFS